MEAYLPYHQSRIHYHLQGSGPLLVLLHGYNHNTRKFDFLIRRLQHRFTVLALDLPYHGFTEWKEGRPFTVKDLHAVITQLQTQANSDKSVQLLGYSMGGRIAMAYFQQYPQLVKSLALIAPDGIRFNPWYKLATATKAGERLFQHTMNKPGWFQRVVDATAKYRLAPKSLTNVVSYFLQNEHVRMELYNRWTSLSTFRPNLRIIQKLLAKHRVHMRMLFGQTDSVVHWKSGNTFQKQNPKWVQVTVIPASHFMINERYADDIAKLLPEE